jgi:hypothetical protein
MDIYMNSVSNQDSFSVEPSQFDHVAVFKRQTYLKLSSE